MYQTESVVDWKLKTLSAFFDRACLQLIADRPPAIEEELDLITALTQLDDFGVHILPLQGMCLIRG